MQRARTRGINWTLTPEQYEKLLAAGACSYCDGALPTNGSGLDRLDNHRGYELANVVACCRWCNGWQWRSTGFLTVVEMRATFALYRDRYGVAFSWPVVRQLSRTGRSSERLATARHGAGLAGRVRRLSRLVREVVSAERLAVARRFDGRSEIEALQRGRGRGVVSPT